ncbi:DUF6115 domain-containing protein [Butyrivibrio sp. VCD2006]|uniref:DUF6115 domain-containing protein n=1 Tax=Butyrivibrio sp. VCD2006 TaxID=1280664 RepID=UPI0003FD78E7|nr:DUF6115 domain-containing protein [Butyrivibrio sp. VCD2006]
MISVTEIILIAAGILAVIIGYLIPGGKESSGFDFDRTNQKINDMVSKAVKNSQSNIDEMLDDSLEEAINKAERALDRVTNEKMSAISEYSDTVMNDIHKNHDEVVFMYDMLNDKHKNLKNTVSEANRAAKEVKDAEARRLALLEEEAKRQSELQAKAREKALREAEERRRAEQEAEARRKAELEAEARRKAEEQRRAEAEEARRKAEAEAEAARRAAAEEEARRKAAAEEEARMKAAAEEEARRKAEVEEASRRFAEVEEAAGMNAEMQARMQAEFDAATKNQTDVKFSSLADILERADEATAQKTQNRVIRSQSEMQDMAMFDNEYFGEDEPLELHAKYWPDSNEEDFVDDTADEVTEKPAKVVSISDASRKKINTDEPANNNEIISDPASRNQKILDMHKQGKSAVVIARELRLGIGEVKLVIDLAGKHKKNRSSII